jgi:hypothetical protein
MAGAVVSAVVSAAVADSAVAEGGPAGREAARRRRRGGRVSLGVLFSEPSVGSVGSSMRVDLPSGSRAPQIR